MESSLLGTRRGLSGTALKRLACISMLLDHIGASCILMGMFADGVAAGQVVMPPDVYHIYTALRAIGRLAFPIYCFLLVEGFLHTHDLRRYAGRMLGFALLSELPFDWAFYGEPFYWNHQNVYWTLLFGIVAMAGLKKWDGSKLIQAGVILGTAVVAELMNTDYGASGVLLIAVLYLLRNSRVKQCVAGAVLVCYELPAPLAFLLVWCYNGMRGACGKVEQWAFYWFYPVHLVILGVITNLILR